MQVQKICTKLSPDLYVNLLRIQKTSEKALTILSRQELSLTPETLSVAFEIIVKTPFQPRVEFVF